MQVNILLLDVGHLTFEGEWIMLKKSIQQVPSIYIKASCISSESKKHAAWRKK